MKKGSFLQGFLGSIVSSRSLFGDNNAKSSIEDLCKDLLSCRGEASVRRLASAIFAKYLEMDVAQKVQFFHYLTDELDLEADAVCQAATNYGNDKTPENLKSLLDVSEPPRQELLRRLNRIPGATHALVSMRADLLTCLRDAPTLKRTDLDFEHLLASWFNRGFLELRRISWESPANVLAKIIRYEAVHAINDWNDLQRRLEPIDRRCFAFFHPTMPDEPLVFVEIALCKGTPGSVQSVLDEDREILNEKDADTAVFYSISNCQAGLRGVSFGNSLIKQVANDLSAELPRMKTFVTLSPLPGLSPWVNGRPTDLPDEVTDDLIHVLSEPPDSPAPTDLTLHANTLKIVAATYLMRAKRPDGSPLDPVARFHLGNGASIHQLHAAADTSPKGRQQSLEVMVNYRYDMKRTEARHEAFASDKTVHASKEIRVLADAKPNRLFDIDNVG